VLPLIDAKPKKDETVALIRTTLFEPPLYNDVSLAEVTPILAVPIPMQMFGLHRAIYGVQSPPYEARK
jgi:hypothetical protein